MSILNDREIPPLSLADKFRITWSLLWPYLVVGIAVDAITASLHLGASALGICSFTFTLFLMFGLFPWAVRRTVHLEFPDFHLELLRDSDGRSTRNAAYWERLRIAWFVLWRSWIALAGVGAVVYFAVLVAGLVHPGIRWGSWSSPAWLRSEATSFGLMIPACALGVIEGLFRKEFQGFSLRIERTAPFGLPANSH